MVCFCSFQILNFLCIHSKIFVKAYDLVEDERDGKTYQKLVDGGQIELSNFKTSGHGVHGRVRVYNCLIWEVGRVRGCTRMKQLMSCELCYQCMVIVRLVLAFFFTKTFYS